MEPCGEYSMLAFREIGELNNKYIMIYHYTKIANVPRRKEMAESKKVYGTCRGVPDVWNKGAS
jgi:hypothetical protein